MKIRYAQRREMDISNGEGIGVALFVQGCSFHCKGCFNQETWDYNKGKEWTSNIKNKFLQSIDNPKIVRVSFLGGDPLYDKNIEEIINLCKEIKTKYPNKKIWLYSGYTFEHILSDNKRKQILQYIDILVDGQFVEELKNLNLLFKGSSNQRIIDIQESLKQNKIILYDV